MLRALALGKRFGDTWIFQDVSLEVAPGEMVAVLGDSGVGKSTLLNGLAGLEPLDAGTVLLDHFAVRDASEAEQARWRARSVGFVFQAFHVLPHLSVAQNIALPLMLQRMPAQDQGARVQALLDAVDLPGYDDRSPRTLSGGQLQRVALARALIHRPKLLLADEPTGNLDTDTAARIMVLLRDQVEQQHAACVLVTHSEAAARQAHRVLRLTRNGMVAVSP